MMDRVCIPESLEVGLREWLSSHPDEHERGAFVLFKKFDRGGADLPKSARWLAVDYVKAEDEWVIDSSPTHIRINLRKLPPLYLRCELEELALGFVHSHPPNALFFSKVDDQNELNILRGYGGCNGPEVSLVALVLSDGAYIARIRAASDALNPAPARHVAIVGQRLDVFLEGPDEPSAILDRQAAAFGKPFNKKLKSLRVGVVGLGGTGSPIATLIARAGVGELILIDGDNLEESNLNRVRGYRKIDVGRRKAFILCEYIRSLDLGGQVAAIDAYVHESPRAVDALSGCDLIFGCTDDVHGRDVLNQAAYYYGLAYIDVGLTGVVDEHDGHAFLRDHRGRVSLIAPGVGACLRCQRVVTDEKLKYEEAVKLNPELKKLDRETLKEEYYLIGGGEAAPGVGPFTSSVADAAVATFMDMVRPFRQLAPDLRPDNIWHDFVHLTIYSNEPLIDGQCYCCGVEGLNAMKEGKYRLGMPSLGHL